MQTVALTVKLCICFTYKTSDKIVTDIRSAIQKIKKKFIEEFKKKNSTLYLYHLLFAT